MWHKKRTETGTGVAKHFFLKREITLLFFRPKTQSNKYTQRISLAILELASKGNQEETWHISKDKKKTRNNIKEHENGILPYTVQRTSLDCIIVALERSPVCTF